jgi:hypothetical protein
MLKARNLAQRQFRNLPPPHSIFAPPRPATPPSKVYVHDFLRNADIDRLSPLLAAIKNLGTLETDRDGLLNLTQAGLQISVSPDLLLRGIRAYDTVLKGAAERCLPFEMADGSVPKILICGEPLEVVVKENTEPVPGIRVRPGERRPQRPTGSLVVSLTAGYRSVKVSDKRARQIESKLPDLFLKAEALATEVHGEHERLAEMQRQREREYRRRRGMEELIEKLDQNVATWMRAKRIRACVQAVAERMAKDGPIPPESQGAKWLEWARRYADNIDPTCGSITFSPQEFGEWLPSSVIRRPSLTILNAPRRTRTRNNAGCGGI